MYEKRIKIFVILSTTLLLVCLLRLIQMQLLPGSSVQSDIEELKRQRGQSQQLKTVRGKILDRNGNILAIDEPKFQLCVDYSLTRCMDDRVRQAMLLSALDKDNPDAVAKVQKKLDAGMADLNQVINKCAQFRAVDPSEIKKQIEEINDSVWNQRLFQAWRQRFPKSELFNKYGNNIESIKISEAIADFEQKEPDPTERLRLINKIDILEMHTPRPLLDLKTDDDIFTAQLEFLNVDGVQIKPKSTRLYPYKTVAAQTIGWVSPVTQTKDKKLFENDKLLSYLEGELGGREDGVEYVCEAILRGKRGEQITDIDSQLISRTDIQPGTDVSLTLDIELQRRIENYLAAYNHEPNCGPGMAAVVIDVGSSDILALVSMPVFDLNHTRSNYDSLIADDNDPLRNRAINERYPPGSVVKPLILIAGLESGKITPDEIISCPAQRAPLGWPSCLIFIRYRTGHDARWPNNARNAIRGSCNIYFSHLADRIDPLVLQQWLFKFGYGRSILFPPLDNTQTELNRNFRQLSGIISNSAPQVLVTSFDQIPPLSAGERRWFGIGQGKMCVTPLQVANAMAAIARHGIYKSPRLFMYHLHNPNSDTVDLGISSETLAIVYDGMSAVVNETSGTAHSTFAPVLAGLTRQGIKVYGKTGSTQGIETAWFGGFLTDETNRSIAVAVVVEGGQSGSSDAAPLARDIIQFCIDYGYIGGSGTTEY